MFFFVFVFRIEMGEAGEVKVAANMFRGMCYEYREQFSAGIIVAGWDKRHGGQVRQAPSKVCVSQ